MHITMGNGCKEKDGAMVNKSGQMGNIYHIKQSSVYVGNWANN